MEFVEIEEIDIITNSRKSFNYSNPVYKWAEYTIGVLQFENSFATTKIKLKQTTRIGDLLAYIGGTLTSMLLVFRLMTKNFQIFNSDLKVYESLDTNTTVFSNNKDDTNSERPPKKSAEQATGYSEKLSLYFGYFSPLSCIWCCFSPTKMKKKIKKIEHV